MTTQPVRRVNLRPKLSPRAMGNLLLGIAGLFVVGGAITLYLTPYPVHLETWHLVALVGGWGIAWFGSSRVLHARLGAYDTLLVAVVALLTGWGLIMQARLAPAMITRQILWLLLGCGAMCGIALTPGLTRILRRYRYTLLTAGILFLGATLILGVNPSGYGQRLWLGTLGFYVQPSEPLKLLLVIYLAAYLSEKRDLAAMRASGQSTWPIVLGPMLVMTGVALLLLAWQQDLGAALLYYLTFVTMLSLAWGKARYAVLSLMFFVPVGIAGYLLSSRVALRVSIWLDPWAPEQADRAFQILQSLFAFSSGGLGGQGLSQGFPGLIPAVHTDFVYAALVEEFGIVGGLALLILFAIYGVRGIQLAQKSDSSFESLLSGGIAALVCVQTWVITAGNAKLIPITGVTLPFLSYGGSSLVTMLAATGLLLNLSTSHPAPLTISLGRTTTPPLRHSAARLGQALILLLASTALASGVWSTVRADELREYPTNPRYVLSEARIRRGKILDRNQVTLADIDIDEGGYVTRTYPVDEAAAVVGYATIEYGTIGIEAACDDRLRGDTGQSAWDSARETLMHIDPVGHDVRLTLDARIQTAAQVSLQGQIGAAVLVDAHTGEILALASSPTFSAETIVEDWETLRDAPESPLLNRATQGLAQPGTSLQPFLLASSWQAAGATTPTGPITTPVEINNLTVNCRRVPQQGTWSAALSSTCPYPFVQAALLLGTPEFEESLRQWGLLDAPSLALETVAVDLGDAPLNVQQEALGQGELLVTPLQMVQAMATLGNDGQRPPLHILARNAAGCPDIAIEPEGENRVVDADIAEAVRLALARYGGVVGHLGSAVAGQERQQAWFIGLNSDTLPRYAVAVIIDRPKSSQVAADVGASLLNLVVELQ